MREPYRNKMKTPKKWLGLRASIIFLMKSERVWKQGKKFMFLGAVNCKKINL